MYLLVSKILPPRIPTHSLDKEQQPSSGEQQVYMAFALCHGPAEVTVEARMHRP